MSTKKCQLLSGQSCQKYTDQYKQREKTHRNSNGERPIAGTVCAHKTEKNQETHCSCRAEWVELDVLLELSRPREGGRGTSVGTSKNSPCQFATQHAVSETSLLFRIEGPLQNRATSIAGREAQDDTEMTRRREVAGKERPGMRTCIESQNQAELKVIIMTVHRDHEAVAKINNSKND